MEVVQLNKQKSCVCSVNSQTFFCRMMVVSIYDTAQRIIMIGK